MPGVAPRTRLMLGLVEVLAISSTLACVMPYSSASSSANTVHLTMSVHCSSPCATAGPSGSLEMISGRMT